MNRDEFLSRTREAALAGRQYRVHAQSDISDDAGRGDVTGDLIDRLATEINAVGGRAHVVDTEAEVRETVSGLVKMNSAKTALVWQHEVLEELGIPDMLRAKGVGSHGFNELSPLDPAGRRQTMLAAEIGISSVDYAIAETGTLALFSKPGQERLVSLLPPVHVAIVRGRQILADLFDLFDQLGATGQPRLPSNLVLITGPSKTGDIELKLTTGVHGPREWHVVILR